VRNYVREGRLKAVKTGKQYRIAGEDLAAMTGRPAAEFEREPVRRHRHIDVTSIVEIDAISPETVSRLSNLLMGAANARGGSQDPLRIETVYDAERARLKIILVGSMDTNSSLFKAIRTVLEAERL
jgi:hypothetical protein